MNINWMELRSQLKPGWSGVNIALVVILFWLSLPLGLLMIAYILWGGSVGLDLSRPETLRSGMGNVWDSIRAGIDNFKSNSPPTTGTPKSTQNTSDQSGFEQWREQESDKLKAERAILDKDREQLEAERKAFRSEREQA